MPCTGQLKKGTQINYSILHETYFFVSFSPYRYLASGDSMISLAFSYRLGHTTVRNSVHMVCAAIKKVMMGRFLPSPTEETWREVAQGFWDKWNFPNCLGAIDGKHVHIQAPPLSGSQYFNYKKLSLLYSWHSWMLTTDSGLSKWGTLGEPATAECMPDLIWGEAWRAEHFMCHMLPHCLVLLIWVMCHLSWWVMRLSH